MAKICVDAGHSGFPDPGAIGPSGLRESDVTLAVAILLQKSLSTEGHQVTMTRTEDDPETDSLNFRCRIANEAQAELFISVHCNAAETPAAQGTETYYLPGSSGGRLLAKAVHDEMVNIGLEDRGIKTANFYVLRYTDMPAVLVELAFISNPAEEALLGNPLFQQQLAAGLSAGINHYLNYGQKV